MKYRVIQMIGGNITKREYSRDALMKSMEVRQCRYLGDNDNPRQREELQGHPRFERFSGPMWDGDAVRYEDTKSYAALSI